MDVHPGERGEVLAPLTDKSGNFCLEKRAKSYCFSEIYSKLGVNMSLTLNEVYPFGKQQRAKDPLTWPEG